MISTPVCRVRRSHALIKAHLYSCPSEKYPRRSIKDGSFTNGGTRSRWWVSRQRRSKRAAMTVANYRSLFFYGIKLTTAEILRFISPGNCISISTCERRSTTKTPSFIAFGNLTLFSNKFRWPKVNFSYE